MQTKFVQTDKTNVASFIKHAISIMDNKVFFNKPYIKKLDVMNGCFEVAQQYLGKDYLFLQDAYSVRLYIRDVFGTKALHLFEDAYGNIVLDIEHALLFYYYMKSQNSPLMDTVTGLVYFMAGHQLDDEFGQISKVAPKNMITPSFKLSENLFSWKRCNHVLRKYMLQLSLPEGYQGFYFEQQSLGQIGFLMYNGLSFSQAKELMKQAQGGIFYTFLPPHVENALFPSILSGGFDTTTMDGYYTQTLISNMTEVGKNTNSLEVYNVYNEIVKPYMIDMIGMVINTIKTEIDSNEFLTPSDFSVYHISPQRVGIMLKEGLNIEHVLPANSKFLKPVTPFNILNVLDGEHL